MALHQDPSYRALPCPRCDSPVSFTRVNASSATDGDWMPLHPRCTNSRCLLSASELDFDELGELDRSLANFVN